MTTVALALSAHEARATLAAHRVDVLLCVTCDEPLELSPRLGADRELRALAQAADARVLDLADLLSGQHPLAWGAADLTHDEPRVRAALGDVTALVLPPQDAAARGVADVLRAVYPDARVRTSDGHDVPAGPVPRVAATRPRGVRRVLRAARVRLHEVVVLAAAWRDLSPRRREPA